RRPAQTASVEQVVQAECELVNCWDELFPEVGQQAGNVMEILGRLDGTQPAPAGPAATPRPRSDAEAQAKRLISGREYLSAAGRRIARGQPLLLEPANREESAQLARQLRVLQQVLDECRDLRRGPEASRRVILVGRGFLADGNNFLHAEGTREREVREAL